MKRELLRMEGITLGDDRHRVLKEVHLALYAGEVLGIYAEHGTVKNSLAGLVTGGLEASAGRLYIDMEPCPFNEPDRFRYRKVGIVRSVSTLIDVLSISENIFVVRRGFRAPYINRQILQEQTRLLMEDFGVSLDPRTLGSQLSTVERCILELIKAVALGARVVVLQDLSSFLSDAEIQQLMILTQGLKQKGTGFLMLESSVGILSSYADRVTVFRGGRSAWTFGTGEFTEGRLKACIFSGKEGGIPEVRVWEEAPATDKEEVLRFEHVSSGVLTNLSFSLHSGESLCLFDRDGGGIAAVKSLLGGKTRPDAGRIFLKDQPVHIRSLREALDLGIAVIAENPTETMIFPDLTALENLCFAASGKTRDFWLNPRYRESCLGEYGPYFQPGALLCYPDQLSDQDLLKLVYCRWHLYNPAVVLCIKPFSSVDKSLEAISVFFMELLQRKGIAVLVLTASESEAGISGRKIEIETSKE